MPKQTDTDTPKIDEIDELDESQDKGKFKRKKGTDDFLYKAAEAAKKPFKPFLYEPVALHEKGEEFNTGKAGLLGGGIAVFAISAFIIGMYGLRNNQTPLPKEAVIAAKAAPAPQPQAPPQPKPVAATPTSQPKATNQAVQAPVGPKQARASVQTSQVDKKALAEQKREEAKASALKRIQARGANREPLTGSSKSGAVLGALPPLPPPPNSALANRGIRAGITPVAYNSPGNPQGQVYPQAQVQAQNQGQAGTPLAFRGARSQSASVGVQANQVAQVNPGYQASQQASNAPIQSVPNSPLPNNQGAGDYGQSAPATVPTLQGGVRQNWSLIAPGEVIRAETRSVIQVLNNTSAGQNTPVFAQVKGAIRSDGRVLIPDGATLAGNVIGVDEALGRVRVEFTQLSFGNTSIPLKGATAWTVLRTGNTGNTSALSEGLPSEATGTPNYVASDAASAVGKAAGSIAQTYGQTSTTSINAFTGTPATVGTVNGDLETSVRRGIASGVASIFDRQVARSDQATSKQESRGPIWAVGAGREFVVYLKEGV
jgi:Bacterial conjugation TrbI-like protein